jgi:hypothetical protein
MKEEENAEDTFNEEENLEASEASENNSRKENLNSNNNNMKIEHCNEDEDEAEAHEEKSLIQPTNVAINKRVIIVDLTQVIILFITLLHKLNLMSFHLRFMTARTIKESI